MAPLKPPLYVPVRTPTVLALVCCAAAGQASGDGTHDPAVTATVYVHGFDPEGASHQGIYGDDLFEPLLDELAGLVSLPTINEPGGAFLPNVVAATTYYGDTPPAYYTPEDIAEIDAVTAQWGGGIPRYALIVAKYARYVMDRSGAQQVNFASASMGSFVTRWLIENDSDGLAAEGKIARWLTLEGVVCGNWAASHDELVWLWDVFGTPTIDVYQMDYGWVEANLHSPRTEADNLYYSEILVGQTGSTDDSALGGALTGVMLLYGDFQPNDGVVSLYDTYFHTMTEQSRFMGRPPTMSYNHVNHYELVDFQGAWAQIATFITERRRVTITMTRVQVTDIHEPDLPFWDWTPAEIVVQSRVYSPEVLARWGISDPLSERHIDGASSPIREYFNNGEEQFLSHIIFDDFVLATETSLEIDLWAEEIDFDVRYGVTEPLGGDYEDLGAGSITVPITQPGAYVFSAADWNCDIAVGVFDYPFLTLCHPPDVNRDGTADLGDYATLADCLLGPGGALLSECGCSDLDDDGDVDLRDFAAFQVLFIAP